MTPADITAIILSYNEEIHIGRCIERIRDHVARIIVIDSGSTDATVEIAEGLGAEVRTNPFVNQAQQFNWALENCPIATGWILRLDCDEYLDDKAIQFLSKLDRQPDAVAGAEFRLKVIFKGQFLRFGGYNSTDLVRLWRAGRGRLEVRWMDERTIVDGAVVKAPGNLVDENLNSIGWWTDKHNRYASRHVLEIVMRTAGEPEAQVDESALLSPNARIKRFLRNKVYLRFPRFVRPGLYWLYRYVLLLGFLDGRMGLVWHFLHGFWYYMLIDAKLFEADRILAQGGRPALVKHFSESVGLDSEQIGLLS